jgi:hypothetical protein
MESSDTTLTMAESEIFQTKSAGGGPLSQPPYAEPATAVALAPTLIVVVSGTVAFRYRMAGHTTVGDSRQPVATRSAVVNRVAIEATRAFIILMFVCSLTPELSRERVK